MSQRQAKIDISLLKRSQPHFQEAFYLKHVRPQLQKKKEKVEFAKK